MAGLEKQPVEKIKEADIKEKIDKFPRLSSKGLIYNKKISLSF